MEIIASEEAWLKTQNLNGPTVEAVRFLGYGYEYPEWFNNVMECDIYLEFGTYYYEDLALTVGCYFLKNRRDTICCIEASDFSRYYNTLPF